ncbi:ArsR/SmtB family transcription factor [Paenibacillus sp. KN14-4R]|uniref:ArsR/SmtB family transcription factor n=1 Tax=Paenibacillus sp. KN14-4R TaxID=3445773 RepID=UPI003F9EDDCF
MVMNVMMHALAEPNRLRIVELLREKPYSVGEIAEKLGLRQPQTSKHLQVLCEAGIVQVQPVANQRIYKLCPQPFEEMDVWLASFRRLWEERFDRLEQYLQQLHNSGQDNDTT